LSGLVCAAGEVNALKGYNATKSFLCPYLFPASATQRRHVWPSAPFFDGPYGGASVTHSTAREEGITMEA